MTEQRVTCREFVEFLWKYLGDELSAEERSSFDAHLERCAKCVRYLQTYQDTIKLGKFALKESEEPVPDEVPEELVQAILSSRK
jgi:anti-sigma factor RsiW